MGLLLNIYLRLLIYLVIKKIQLFFFLNIHYLFCQQIDSEAVFEMSNEDLVKYVKKTSVTDVPFVDSVQ